jgi:hypothetical protein
MMGVFVVGGILGAVVGGFCVALGDSMQHHHDHFLWELSEIEPAIRADPEFKVLTIEERSDGELRLYGAVPTDASKKRLLQILTRGVGETEARAAAGMLRVEPSASK